MSHSNSPTQRNFEKKKFFSKSFFSKKKIKRILTFLRKFAENLIKPKILSFWKSNFGGLATPKLALIDFHNKIWPTSNFRWAQSTPDAYWSNPEELELEADHWCISMRGFLFEKQLHLWYASFFFELVLWLGDIFVLLTVKTEREIFFYLNSLQLFQLLQFQFDEFSVLINKMVIFSIFFEMIHQTKIHKRRQDGRLNWEMKRNLINLPKDL